MDNVSIGLLGLGCALALIAVRVPIGVALGLVSLLLIVFFPQIAPLLPGIMWQ